MKIIKCIIIIFINIIGTVNAEEKIDSSFQFGNYGFGLNFCPDKNNIELSLGLVNIIFNNTQTNISLKISPFNLYTNIEATDSPKTKSVTYLNFININLYWNCLNENNLFLGPFMSSEYLVLRNWGKIVFNDITINTGIKLIYKTNGIDFSSINYHSEDSFYAIEIEIGYRYNIYDAHKFYFTMKTDLISTLLFIANIGASFNR